MSQTGPLTRTFTPMASCILGAGGLIWLSGGSFIYFMVAAGAVVVLTKVFRALSTATVR